MPAQPTVIYKIGDVTYPIYAGDVKTNEELMEPGLYKLINVIADRIRTNAQGRWANFNAVNHPNVVGTISNLPPEEISLSQNILLPLLTIHRAGGVIQRESVSVRSHVSIVKITYILPATPPERATQLRPFLKVVIDAVIFAIANEDIGPIDVYEEPYTISKVEFSESDGKGYPAIVFNLKLRELMNIEEYPNQEEFIGIQGFVNQKELTDESSGLNISTTLNDL